MAFRIHRPRQVVGLVYTLMYILIFLAYLFILKDDQSWAFQSKLTVTVFLWFILSLAVKVSMFMDRAIELLNLSALLAFLSLGFTYHPLPGQFSSIEDFCYYLYFIGGSACDFFDFFYEAAAKRPDDSK